jgi:hypothetical protein
MIRKPGNLPRRHIDHGQVPGGALLVPPRGLPLMVAEAAAAALPT